MHVRLYTPIYLANRWCCAGFGDAESVAAVRGRAHRRLSQEEEACCRCTIKQEEETEGCYSVQGRAHRRLPQEEIHESPIEEKEREGSFNFKPDEALAR